MDLFHIGIYFCKNDSPATDDTNWAWLVSPSGYLGGYVNHGVDNSYRRKKRSPGTYIYNYGACYVQSSGVVNYDNYDVGYSYGLRTRVMTIFQIIEIL